MGCCAMKTLDILRGDRRKITTVKEIRITPGNLILGNHKYFYSTYRPESQLGCGSYGEVLLCVHTPTNELRAAKILQFEGSHTEKEAIYKEIQILRLLDHPHIIRIHDFYINQNEVYIIMDYCPGGELSADCTSPAQQREEFARDVLRQVFSAVAYLHSNSIIHRDIKPANILLDGSSECPGVQLSDFGTATLLKSHGKIREQKGSLQYAAPEVITGKYDEKCDLWSCGVVLYYLLSGDLPFYGKNEAELCQAIKRGAYDLHSECWTELSVEAKLLVQQLLCPSPVRLSAVGALSHSWFPRNPVDHSENELIVEKLAGYTSSNRLKDAVLTFLISHCIPQQELKKYQDFFKKLDMNGDGRVVKEELVECLAENSKFNLDRIIEELDGDGNQCITYSEFLKAALDVEEHLTRLNLKSAFQLFDRNRDGRISAAELRNILQSKNESSLESVWEEVIRAGDTDGDGFIDVKEFVELLRSAV